MIFSKIRNQHSFLQKALLFLLTTGLIVLLFPRTGSFKYEFQKGTPWKHETLMAPYDFPILKSDEDVSKERDEIKENHKPTLVFDPTLFELKAEEFINNINNNLAKSKLTFAKGEHEIVEQKLQQAKTEILAFQSKYNVLDPTAEGAAFQQIAFSLEATLAQKKAELSTMSTMMSNVAPEVINIKREIAALQKEVEKQKERISTAEGESEALSVSELMAQYSNLQVQLQLAIQAYSSSLITLENARVEAYQKLQHLVTVESPTLPDDNAYPTVIYNLVLFGVSLLLIYGIVRIIVATIREL